MAKYAIFFTLKGETIARGMENPTDRSVAVSKLTDAAGGKLEAYYWMMGDYDGFAIIEMPDSATAAAVSLAVSSTGVFGHIATHELFDAKEVVGLLGKAKGLRGSYSPPGSPA
jgi:uncharacterized protein with GYD domain